MESLQRTLLKTVVWRVAATLITFITIYAFTGELGRATNITLVAATLLAAGYYLHERFWDHVEWGRRGGDSRIA